MRPLCSRCALALLLALVSLSPALALPPLNPQDVAYLQTLPSAPPARTSASAASSGSGEFVDTDAPEVATLRAAEAISQGRRQEETSAAALSAWKKARSTFGPRDPRTRDAEADYLRLAHDGYSAALRTYDEAREALGAASRGGDAARAGTEVAFAAESQLRDIDRDLSMAVAACAVHPQGDVCRATDPVVEQLRDQIEEELEELAQGDHAAGGSELEGLSVRLNLLATRTRVRLEIIRRRAIQLTIEAGMDTGVSSNRLPPRTSAPAAARPAVDERRLYPKTRAR